MSGVKHAGLGHWKSQRISSVLLVPLTAWLLWAIVTLAGADYAMAITFFKSPFHAAMAIVTSAITVHHAQSGVTVVCEDYVHPLGLQKFLVGVTRAGCLIGFMTTIYAIYRIWQVT
jgi:succinate dehydrogenase / fumarate reductase membrane anchor subunit